jgi:hypothetical protein
LVSGGAGKLAGFVLGDSEGLLAVEGVFGPGLLVDFTAGAALPAPAFGEPVEVSCAITKLFPSAQNAPSASVAILFLNFVSRFPDDWLRKRRIVP